MPKSAPTAPMLAAAPAARRPVRILIVRLTALGDVIHGLPVACALRAALPEAVIGWVVEGRNAELLDGHPALDHVITTPRRWMKSPRAILDLRRRLRALEFDVAVDLQCLTKSAVAAWLSGAPRRIGKAGAHGRELSRWLHNELVDVAGRHVIDHYLEMLRPLGIDDPQVNFDVPETLDDAHMADEYLRSRGLLRRGFAILNPGAGWPSKIWPPERYGEVAAHLRDAHGLPSVAVWGAPAERELAQQIVAASRGAAHLGPPTSVPELAALSRRAALFIGSDTGPMHLAVAVETPTISLHGPSSAEWCGAYGPTNLRLQAQREEGAANYRRQATNEAMCAITVEMVVRGCDELLARPYQRKAG